MFGLTRQGFKRKRYAEIVAGMELRAKDMFGENVNLSVRSPLGMFIKVIAFVAAELWELAESVYHADFVDTAEGVQLDHVAKRIGIRRRGAESASGEVTFTGTNGTVIPNGFVVAFGDLQFRTVQSVTITSETATVEIVAVDTGSQGNVPANSITQIVNPLAGVTSVTNAEPTAGGRERETDLELRERYERSIARPGSSKVDAIRASLLDLVPGIVDAVVEENATMDFVDDRPPKSIEAIVYGGQDADIAQVIFDTKAGGIQAYGTTTLTIKDLASNDQIIGFTRAEFVDIFVEISNLQTDATFPANGVDRVRRAVIEYIGGADDEGTFYPGIGLGKDVIFIRLIKQIQQVPGILDFDLLIGTDPNALGTINLPMNNKQVSITDMDKVEVV